MSVVKVDEHVIAEWIEQGASFVVYREPGQLLSHGMRALSDALLLNDISSLNGREGFVFAPFQTGKEHPLWLIPADEYVCFNLSDTRKDIVAAPAAVPVCGTLHEMPSADYAHAFGKFSTALKAGDFQKLVLSRKEPLKAPSGFSLLEAYRVACQRYIHSYVYLLYTPQTGFWLGATPEILLSGSRKHYRTMALAGTLALENGIPTQKWSEKNIREQRYVTEYICDCLRERGIEPMLCGPFTVTAGALAHLKTDILFSLSSTDGLGDLLAALHPTPAVCGLPKQEAYRFICEHEGYDRSYYAGFLGRLNPEGETDIYVNLRCMQMDGGDAPVCLFAGGGLLSASVLEDEWMETERKLQTMKYVIYKSAISVE